MKGTRCTGTHGDRLGTVLSNSAAIRTPCSGHLSYATARSGRDNGVAIGNFTTSPQEKKFHGPAGFALKVIKQNICRQQHGDPERRHTDGPGACKHAGACVLVCGTEVARGKPAQAREGRAGSGGWR